MNKDFEKTYHEVEAAHWWFVTRRRFVRELVRRAAPDRRAAILEIGCSGGPLLQMLTDDGFSNLAGIDISPEGIELCRQKKLGRVQVMDARAPDFPAGSFDVIIASDVLEHLPDAPAALAAWQKLLRPGGKLLVFVPAFRFLWSGHDVVNQHFHRYRAGELAGLLTRAGYQVERRGYWNFFLFLPVAAVRGLKRVVGRSDPNPSGDLRPLPALLNGALIALLRLENRLLLWGCDFPWGVSAMVIGRRPVEHA